MINEDEDKESETISLNNDQKTYSTGHRKAAYSCTLKQVPGESTATVISTVVKEVTGLTVKENSDATTVSQFAYELSVLNDVQVRESVGRRRVEFGMRCHLPSVMLLCIDTARRNKNAPPSSSPPRTGYNRHNRVFSKEKEHGLSHTC